MKQKVAIIGATGMVGSAVYKQLMNDYDVLPIYRNASRLNALYKKFGKKPNKTFKLDVGKIYNEYLDNNDNPSHTLEQKLCEELSSCDAVVNCLGVIKPFARINPALTFFINSAFPHLLSRRLNEKLIHITTDCVFNGRENAPYSEKSKKSPNDIYGLSKSLGEPIKSLVLRTSVIGTELDTAYSLVEWARAKKGSQVDGYTNHYWNGVTADEFGKICFKIISNRKRYPKNGIYHIFSDSVSKYEILEALNSKYHLNMVIQKKKVNTIDRRLTTIYPLNKDLGVAGFEDMIREL